MTTIAPEAEAVVEIDTTTTPKKVGKNKLSRSSLLTSLFLGCAVASVIAATVFHLNRNQAPTPQDAVDPTAIDLGQATVDDNITTVTGPAVLKMVSTAQDALASHAHTTDAILHATHETHHRRLNDVNVPSDDLDIKLRITYLYSNRSDLPPGATVVDTHDGLMHFALQRPDRDIGDLQPFVCDQTSCRAVSPPAAGRALWQDGVRWFCSLTCTVVCRYVTTLVQEAFISWACEPLADYVCADLVVTNEEVGSGTSAHNFCRQAVEDSCAGELPIGSALEQMRSALHRHWEREAGLGWLVEVGGDFVGSALDYALGRLDEVMPDEWGVANSTYYLVSQRWTERTEEVCDEVCSESCSAIIIAIIEFFESLCYPADAPVRALDAFGVPQLAPISSIKVGDLVQTPHGFEPVIFQGHATMRPALYMVIGFDSNHTIELSPDHYFKSADAYLLAKHVEIGMSAHVEGSATAATVVSVETAFRRGAYNPYTPSGSIVVADVHATCHSSWFLEAHPSLVPPKHVPAAYQALLAPVRAMHRWAPGFSRAFAEAFEGRNQGMADVGAVELLATAIAVKANYNAK